MLSKWDLNSRPIWFERMFLSLGNNFLFEQKYKNIFYLTLHMPIVLIFKTIGIKEH
jgi:hypothetical protein